MRWLIVVTLSVACREPTQMVVAVTTDVPCTHVTDVAISVGALGTVEGKPPTAVSVSCDQSGKLGSIVVVPSGDRSNEVAIRVVSGLNGRRAEDCAQSSYKGGCIVARRALHFLPHSSITVPILLEGACRDIACSPNTTCVGGECVGADTNCQGSTCNVGSDGGAPALPVRWRPMTAPATSYAPTCAPVTVWTGREMIVWGGSLGYGVAYDPSSDSWRSIPPSLLSERCTSFAVWAPTVGRVVMWAGQGGGYITQDGAQYDPAGSWSPMSSPPPQFLTRFQGGAAVWSTTTHEVLIWGGHDTKYNSVGTGAAYDPATDRWRMIAASTLNARSQLGAVWASDRMVVFDGYGSDHDYASYDPVTDTWSSKQPSPLPARANSLAVTLNGQAIFWGGSWNGTADVFGNGLIINPLDGSNQVISEPTNAVIADNARREFGGWASHGRLWFWGGGNVGAKPDVPLGDGAIYDFASQTWTKFPTDGAPSARFNPSVVWTGKEAIFFGGFDGTGTWIPNGAIFGP